MNAAQAISYIETVAPIPAEQMSRSMVKFMRSCARLASGSFPVDADGTVAGYYDPEYSGVRANVAQFQFAPVDCIPQSDKLRALIWSKTSDPFGSTLDLI